MSDTERLDALEAENERLQQLVAAAPAYESDARNEIDRLRAENERLLEQRRAAIKLHTLAEMKAEALREKLKVVEQLSQSLNDGVLFGNFNEPLDAYGKRIIRVVLVEFDRACAAAAKAKRGKR